MCWLSLTLVGDIEKVQQRLTALPQRFPIGVCQGKDGGNIHRPPGTARQHPGGQHL